VKLSPRGSQEPQIWGRLSWFLNAPPKVRAYRAFDRDFLAADARSAGLGREPRAELFGRFSLLRGTQFQSPQIAASRAGPACASLNNCAAS
jgi:hypothetical protein